MFISDENKKKCLIEKYRLKKTLTMEDYIKKQIEYNYDNEEYLKMFKFYIQNFFNIFIPQNSKKKKKNENI